MKTETTINVGSDFSGVGAFNQALMRLEIEYNEVFACDMDKFARKTFIHNYGEPKYYPSNVYDREIPGESLDIYMTSPPCQAFSLAGKRKGENDKRGILFYNSLEFIKVNNPRFFIFENVKGLLSMDNGQTFQNWLTFLGGKSVNGNPIIFPHEKSVPYHIYHTVLNAKHYGVPQNRERVFIVGIRDEQDNDFTWPIGIELKTRLKDLLESEVDDKYFLSEKMVEGFTGIDVNDASRAIRCGGAASLDDKHNWDIINLGFINQDTQASQVYSDKGIGQTLSAGTHGYSNGYVSIGAIRGRNPDNPKLRKAGMPTEQMLELNMNGTSNALTTVQKDNVVVYAQLRGDKWEKTHEQSGRVYDIEGIGPTLHTMGGGNQEPKVVIHQLPQGKNKGGKHFISPAVTSNAWEQNNLLEVCSTQKEYEPPLYNDRRLNEYVLSNDPKADNEFINTYDQKGFTDVTGTITTRTSASNINFIRQKTIECECKYGFDSCLNSDLCDSCDEGCNYEMAGDYEQYKIRKLTPRECFRLMDFPDSFDFSCVSNSQAYKQAGNSIVVAVLAAIIAKLKIK
ncbi:DNA (cytosine-5-)-methyltransferase [Myroides odoratimimus]|uniref:DNA cytosine methyltransferase n=1 Tax=Myroides odoratimimus TaxID=76832 RepID=UPI00257538D6|nr:DNA (cytosine-5-)-methyltransferase [Myroides odoratimimus]MDM1396082.1 DNA (cytosine-5-)-methyltransferase [Myroides odoratimimus]